MSSVTRLKPLKTILSASKQFINQYVSKASIHFTCSCSKRFQPEPHDKFFLEPKCKVALITGAEGIGFACAHQLLQNGARGVVILGVDPIKGKEAALSLNCSFGKGRSIFINSNVNCMVQFEEAFREAKREYGGLDIVINAAGIIDGHQWEREVVTNLIGTIRGTLLAYKYISRANFGGGGVIINMSGVTGLEPLSSAPTLSAEHHAIVGLSRSFGHEMHNKKTGVRVICLCPGFTKTSFIKRVKEKSMCVEYGLALEKEIASAAKQNPDAIGKAAVHVIRHAESGSVWVVEGSKLYQTEIPQRTSYMKLAAQYY
ncbi:15-hydroxyprostaglandin dehydrogenase [NAD(+)]-like [Agrilus planipennis]|uniref:15-hydroxyprostaglandin dehydrogenase [NAD(+)]-like n=1 Tax=Agrilus planipennis TaxID=224129 RepID=A0A1W4WBZ1_AGRPL|nr:15-hydroxyprostaglandin dehydrogenase [NAD(+)]-like [Agrilus planipennis]